jgi:hypothetical protein
MLAKIVCVIVKKKMLSALTVVFLAVGVGAPIVAQDVRTDPVGFLVQTIPAGQTRSFSVPFDASPSSQPGAVDRLSGVGTNHIEGTVGNWTPGAFSMPAAPYFVRFIGGANAGRTFRIVEPANTGSRLNLADDGIDLTQLGLSTGASGTPFEIIPGDTLGTFFGKSTLGDSLVVQGAADPSAADLIQVWGGAAWLNFYFNTTWQRWARDIDIVTDPSRNDYLLRPDRGLMIARRGSTPLPIMVVGRVLNAPQRAVHARTESALTFLAPMQAANTTLGALALQNGDRTTAWRGGSNAAEADLLIVWSGATWFSFFYNNTVGQWHRVGESATNRDDFELKAGTPVFVQRRGTGSTIAEKTVSFPATAN